MKFKISLLVSAVLGFLVIAGSLVSANSEVVLAQVAPMEIIPKAPKPTELTPSGTEANAAVENVDQAAITPKNDADKAAGVEVWGNIYKVLSHPRCVNCHVPDDRPRWSGKSYGKTQVHGMNVQATATRMGMPGQQMCLTCHSKLNADVPHGPPGAAVWALAPVEMTWWGKSSQELCTIVKDPAKTGGRDITAFADHIGHDALVAWGWDPGVGREPAPFSAKETVVMLEQWLALGLPCPE